MENNKNLKIGISGATGKMGRALISEVLASKNCTLGGALEIKNNKNIDLDVGDFTNRKKLGVILDGSPINFLKKIDVAIDFSSPQGTVNNIDQAAKKGIPVVSGTTGLSKKQMEHIKSASLDIPIVWAPNMSVGINLALALTYQAVSVLDSSFDVEVFELHHRDKIDSPSGTAIALAKVACDARNLSYDKNIELSNYREPGPRPKNSIGITVARGGNEAGEHKLMLIGEGERVEIKHRALNREIFAKGAILAAKWIFSKSPGFYGMKDVLNIKY